MVILVRTFQVSMAIFSQNVAMINGKLKSYFNSMYSKCRLPLELIS